MAMNPKIAEWIANSLATGPGPGGSAMREYGRNMAMMLDPMSLANGGNSAPPKFDNGGLMPPSGGLAGSGGGRGSQGFQTQLTGKGMAQMREEAAQKHQEAWRLKQERASAQLANALAKKQIDNFGGSEADQAMKQAQLRQQELMNKQLRGDIRTESADKRREMLTRLLQAAF